MERITISVDERLAKEFDRLIQSRGITSRSEAMRDLLRRELEANRLEHDAKSWCIANLSYVYNHHIRNLSARLNEAQHEHHDLVISTMHIHLDHEHCFETVMLKGRTATVQAFAQQLRTERGVHHCELNIVIVAADDKHHMAGYHHHHGGHLHLIPQS